MIPSRSALSLGQCATLACLLEAAAPKPGNVHRGADFEDLTFNDLAVSAVAIAPAIDAASSTGIGAAALAAIRATRQLVNTNTNLGIVLLVAPLAAVPREEDLKSGVSTALKRMTEQDSRDVYEAIRLAAPGGLGVQQEMDISGDAPPDLLDAMKLAAPNDLVARQYANDFSETLDLALPSLVRCVQDGWPLTGAIIRTHLRLMSECPDTLIARKCGEEAAQQAADRAAHALQGGMPDDEEYLRRLGELDFWLRSDGHRRNPGATADVLAAALFAALRDGMIDPPWR